MKNKLNVSLLLSVFLVITLMSFASATVVDLEIPSSSSTIIGNISLQASINSNSSNYGNCSWYVKSAGLTANNSQITINLTTSNATQGLWTYISYNTTNTIEDSNDYIFNVTCINKTDTLSDTSTGIIIQNTVPATPTSLSPSGDTTDTDGSINFSSTVAGNTTTSCILYFSGTNPGSTSYTMTHTKSTCSYTLSGIPEQTYLWYIRASDETDTANSATNRVSVDSSSGTRRINEEQQKESIKSLTLASDGDGETPTWLILGVVILVVFGVIYFINKK